MTEDTTGTETSTETTDATEQSATTATDTGDQANAETVLGSAAADNGAGDTDGSTESGEAPGDDTQEGADDVPEAYELKVTTKDAEGKDVDVEIDPVLLEKATPVLKDVGLTNEQANKVASLVPEIQARIEQKQADDFAAMKAQWAKDAQADTEIGGANWKETQNLAAKALDKFIGPAVNDKGEKNPFRQMLDDTGLGNHPEMIRAFRNVGAAIAEDGSMPRSDHAIQKKSREEELYPDDVPKK